MPTIPPLKSLSASALDILNTIRNNASTNYRNYIPEATTENIPRIGNIMMDYPVHMNEFLSALVNRIGMTIINSAEFSNPWAVLKGGRLENGETIEEIFVNIAKPHLYSAETAETEVERREMPDVRSAFHPLNCRTFYKTTVQRQEVGLAFNSVNGVIDLINKIIGELYTSAEYDEFNLMKYCLARAILDGRMKPVAVSPLTSETANGFVKTLKKVSNDFEFLSENYNPTGVKNSAKKNRQYLVLTSESDAVVSVDVLAKAFNMNEVQFTGHEILSDGFGSIDHERLNELFADEPYYTPLTAAEIEALSTIPAVLISRDFIKQYDKENLFTERFNEQGLYWNYWYHKWAIYSTSPFENAAVFVPGTPTVSSVTVSPSTASGSVGAIVPLSVNVVTSNFAAKTVNWTSNNAKVTVDKSGTVAILDGATGTATITATSTENTSKKSTCTITIV